MRRALGAVLLLSLPALAVQETKTEKVEIPGKGVTFDLVLIPGGPELLPYWIGKHEVTWDEYSLYYESYKERKTDGMTRPSQPDVKDPKEAFENGAQQTGRHPANQIGWYGAMGYCAWLSKKTGQRYRLPTEAEWLHACGKPDDLDEAAWHAGNAEEQTHAVGEKKANAFGLHDMLGNVWENVLEPMKPPAYPSVLKGGSWKTPAEEVSPAARQEIPDEWLESDPKRPLRLWWVTDGPFIGMRLVRVPDSPMAEVEAAAAKVKIENLKVVAKPRRPEFWTRVSGEVVNGGSDTLTEVEVTVFYLDEESKPMTLDPKDKPAYNVAYPVLVNSGHPGSHRKPLAPGERRAFELEVPHPHVEAGPLDLSQVGGKVTGVRVKK